MPGGEKDLIINVKLDRSAAKREQRAHAEEQKAIEREMTEAAQATENTKVNAARRSNRARVDEAVRASRAIADAAKEEEKAIWSAIRAAANEARAAKKEVQQFEASVIGVGAQLVGIQALTRGFGQLKDAIVAAKREQMTQAEKAVADANRLRELAAIRGVAPDTGLALDVAKSARAAMAPVANAQQFLTALEGSSGDAMARMGAGFQAFKQDALRLGEALNVDPAQMASFSGQVLRAGKFTDPDAARRSVAQSMSMLQNAPGEMPKLIMAANQIMSRVGADPNLSQLTDIRDVMPLVSIAEVTKPGQGGAYAENALKAIKEASQSEAGKKIGLDPTASVDKTLPQLIPWLRQQARTRPLFDVVEQDLGIKDLQASAVLSTMVQQSETFLRDLASARGGAAGDKYFGDVTRRREGTAEAKTIQEQADREIANLQMTQAQGNIDKLNLAMQAGTRAVRGGQSTSAIGQMNLQTAGWFTANQDEAAQAMERARLPMSSLNSLSRVPGLGGLVVGAQSAANTVLNEIADGIRTLVGIEQAKGNLAQTPQPANVGMAVVPPPRMPGPPMANPQRRPGP